MSFEKGQRVRCVGAGDSLGLLVNGRIYTVDFVAVCPILNRPMVTLVELPNEDWFEKRFVPAEEL